MYHIIRISLLILVAIMISLSGIRPATHNKQKYTEANVMEVYKKLAVSSGEQDIPPLVIVNSTTINAWTNGARISITTGLLEAINNDDELALTIAHEMAHAINHDMAHYDVSTVNQEAHADKLGAFIMMRAGYNICNGRNIFQILKSHYGDSAVVLADDHPNEGYRYDQVSMPWCNYGR